jgi:hypothetical protein
MPGVVTVGTFSTFDEAEAERRLKEGEVRKRVNPFACGQSLSYQTHLPEPIFLDWLRDVSLEPPEPADGQRDWVGWWDRLRDKLSEEQIAHVWAGLDRIGFYEVIERRCAVGYAVVEVNWEYNDNWYEPGQEGGTPVQVFLRRDVAEACLMRLNGEAVSEESDENELNPEGDYEANRWLDEPNWPFIGPMEDYRTTKFVRGSAAVRFEIVEVELPDLLPEGNANG